MCGVYSLTSYSLLCKNGFLSSDTVVFFKIEIAESESLNCSSKFFSIVCVNLFFISVPSMFRRAQCTCVPTQAHTTCTCTHTHTKS